MNGQQLTVYDFLVDLIPGVFAVPLLLSVVPADVIGEMAVADVTLGSSALIIVVGYFLGHLVQAVASPVDDWVYFLRRDRYPFEEAVTEVDDDSVPGRFVAHVDEFFALKDGDTADGFHGGERFKLTQSYLWNHNVGRAQRFQVLYTFLRSMWVLLMFGAVLQGMARGLAAVTAYDVVWTPVQSAVIIAGLLAAAVISYLRRLHYQQLMVDAMIVDFYANVLTQQD